MWVYEIYLKSDTLSPKNASLLTLQCIVDPSQAGTRAFAVMLLLLMLLMILLLC